MIGWSDAGVLQRWKPPSLRWNGCWMFIVIMGERCCEMDDIGCASSFLDQSPLDACWLRDGFGSTVCFSYALSFGFLVGFVFQYGVEEVDKCVFYSIYLSIYYIIVYICIVASVSVVDFCPVFFLQMWWPLFLSIFLKCPCVIVFMTGFVHFLLGKNISKPRFCCCLCCMHLHLVI